MGILQALFGRSRNYSASSGEIINAIMSPLGELVCDFKDETGICWTVIVPAVHTISARLSVQGLGLEATRDAFALNLKEREDESIIPSSAILGMTMPPHPPEQLAEVNILLWRFANDMIAKGHPVEFIAQAFGKFAIIAGKSAVDEIYVLAVMSTTCKELQSDNFV